MLSSPGRDPSHGSTRSAWLLWIPTILIGLVGLLQILLLSGGNSATFDEPHHLATGLEFLQYGTYRWWTENPPLGRIAVALLPYLEGVRLPPPEVWDPTQHSPGLSWSVGLDMLNAAQGYEHNLRLARLGSLPFYVLALGVSWQLVKGYRYPLAGLVTVGLCALVPVILAHAGLATTDMAAAATTLLAMWGFRGYLERPSRSRAVLTGLGVAVAVLTKFSAVAFLVVMFLALLIGRRVHARSLESGGTQLRGRTRARHAACAVAAAGLGVWMGYGFSFDSIDSLPQLEPPFRIYPFADQQTPVERLLYSTPVPAPELSHGLLWLRRHMERGHPAYLLGSWSRDGFWFYYPVLFWFKTPLAFLTAVAATLAGVGVAVFRRAQTPRGNLPEPLRDAQTTALVAVLAALGILVSVLPSRMNLGLRHILVVYPLLAIAAGSVTAQYTHALRSRRYRHAAPLIAAFLVVGQLGSTWNDRHQLLSSFNTLAGKEPGAIALDSDLDWGQDLFRLRDYLTEHHIDSVKLAYLGTTNPCRQNLPNPTVLPTTGPSTGWIALSEFYARGSTYLLRKHPCAAPPWLGYDGPEDPFAWLRQHEPVMRLPSIRVYHLD